jgi:hypothetical protein
MPWGEKKRFVFQNHAVSICERADRSFIGSDEAYFVAGILNTKIVEQFIYASSDNRSFKIRPPVFVPLFDKSDTVHMSILKLAKAAAKNKKQQSSLLAELEDQYLRLCAKRK